MHFQTLKRKLTESTLFTNSLVLLHFGAKFFRRRAVEITKSGCLEKNERKPFFSSHK